MTLQVEFQPQTLGADAGSTYRVPTPGPQGEPGYSPTVTVETIPDGHRVTITDAAGDHVFAVMDGEPGPEGYSPVVTITEISGGHRVTITDAEHPDGQSFDVMDGTGGGGGTSDYEDLSNLPQIAGVTLIGNKSLADLGAGTYSKPSGGIPKTDLASGVQTSLGKADTAYQKPSGGIPKTNLASGVQSSLDKADAALPKTGGAMSGAIAMGSNKITGLAAGTADGDAVNVSQMSSAISQSAAYFRGSFASRAALLAVSWQTSDPETANYVTNNDYAVVLDDETQNDECWRYTYVSGTGWAAQYRINETPLTQAQLDALNSGATAANIGAIAGKYDANNPPPYPVTSVNGSTGAVTTPDTTYAISISGNVITLTPSSGAAQSITLPVYNGGVS